MMIPTLSRLQATAKAAGIKEYRDDDAYVLRDKLLEVDWWDVFSAKFPMIAVELDWGVEITKAPPGPPPNPDWEWHEETRRWRNPENWREEHYAEDVLPDTGELKLSDVLSGPTITVEDMETIGNKAVISFEPTISSSYVDALEQQAVSDYTKTGFSKANAFLRGEEAADPFTKNLIQEIVGLMSPLEEIQVLYRGMSTQPDVMPEVGKEWLIDSFFSCSRDAGIPVEFLSKVADWTQTVFEIEARPSTRGITLSDDDTGTMESETILDYGQKLQVTGMRNFEIEGDGFTLPVLYVQGTIGE